MDTYSLLKCTLDTFTVEMYMVSDIKLYMTYLLDVIYLYTSYTYSFSSVWDTTI